MPLKTRTPPAAVPETTPPSILTVVSVANAIQLHATANAALRNMRTITVTCYRGFFAPPVDCVAAPPTVYVKQPIIIASHTGSPQPTGAFGSELFDFAVKLS